MRYEAMNLTLMVSVIMYQILPSISEGKPMVLLSFVMWFKLIVNTKSLIYVN